MTALRRSTVLVVAASLIPITVGTVIGSGLGSSPAVAATAVSRSNVRASLAARTTPGAVPQPVPARAGARWLASQQSPLGFMPTAPGSGVPSLSATAQTILALSAANVDPHGASLALSYMESNVDSYVTVDAADGPGQLALLILDAEALGVDPTTFGGTNLVSRLLATQQTTGADAGLFGTEQQLDDYYTGTYQQGLALVALAAAGVRGTSQTHAADAWLVSQQCPGGGWTLPDMVLNTCAPTSVDPGPDTNSTSFALQGLVAQGALTPGAGALGLEFLATAQDADAGWSYLPNTVATPGVSDPDSTALVIQALLAMGDSPAAATFTKGSATPVSALLSFQFSSGPDAGAFYYPPAVTPDIPATYEPVPALAGLPFGWGPSGNGYWEVASDGGIFNFGAAASFLGSAGEIHLNAPVVGLASTSNGGGYWEVASDGGIFTYGDANFYGSMGGKPLNKPVVGITATPDGLGYWEVASDGGIFSFGDANFYGSMGGKPLNKPIVGIAATPDGLGYWEVASDGGIFSFGDAAFHGSMGGTVLNKPIVGIAATPDGLGYWEVASDGGIFNFGDAAFLGSTGSIALNAPIVGISASPARPT
jgi:hypothetical protein